MDYLTKLSEQELKTILHFTEKLVEKQTVNGEIDFDADVEQAEISAKEFAHRRNAGFRNTEIKEDSETRKSVREWLKRKNRYTNL